MTAEVTIRKWKIFIKGRLFKICHSEAERQSTIKKLRQDKTLKPGDIECRAIFSVEI